MSAPEKYPSWLPMSTTLMDSNELRCILGSRSTREKANAWCYMDVYLWLGRMPMGVMDISNKQQMSALAHELKLSVPACRALLDEWAEFGAIDPEHYAQGRIFIQPVFERVQGYVSKCRVNQRNGKQGGRPKADKEPKTNPDANPEQTQKQTEP